LAVKRRFKNAPYVCTAPAAKETPKIKETADFSFGAKKLPSRSGVRGAGARTFNSFCRIARSLSAALIKASVTFECTMTDVKNMWFLVSKWQLS
jgi:hypothetical protein